MSLLRRTSPGALASLAVTLVAAAVILVSTGAVLTRDYPPRLAVEVRGVPGYVYYDRDYPLTIEYANAGREAAPSASVSAIIPAGFTLDGVTHATADEPQSFVWNVGDLAPGQRGEITVNLRGVLPTDLTGAVYNLPGYVGHTAFVDGFEMKVALTSAGASITHTATADTGAAVVPCANPSTQFGSWICIIKDATGPDADTATFDFDVNGGPTGDFDLQDGDIPASVGFGACCNNPGSSVTITELPESGWILDDIGCTTVPGFSLVINVNTRSATVTWNTDLLGQVVCTFFNIQEEEPTPEPTREPDPTPRATTQPNLGGGLGGLFAGQPTALPTARPATAPAATAPAITPPRTGDAGLQ